MQYLFVCLFLFFGFFAFYVAFDMYIKGSEFDKKEIQFLSYKLEQQKLAQDIHLEAQNSSQSDDKQKSTSREIASVKTEASVIDLKKPDFVELYFTRFTDLRMKNKKQEAMNLLEKIKKSTTEEEQLARADYELIELNCASGELKEICVNTLDGMVGLYPTSEWTGMGLAWLSMSYKKNNRKEDSRKISELIEKDFLDSTRVKEKMKYLFKNNLIE